MDLHWTKVAIVSGGTRGIGRGIAECLARDGFQLVLGYNSNMQRAQTTCNELTDKYHVRAKHVSGDIADSRTLENLFEAAQDLMEGRNQQPSAACVDHDKVDERSPGVDQAFLVYVHNAGLTPFAAAKQLGLPEGGPWDERLYNYFQKVYCHSFRRAMELGMRWGGFRRVVAISSVGCNCCQNPTGFFYEAAGQAKASLEYLVRVFAKQLAKDGITVNAVIPGPIETEAWDSLVQGTGMDLPKFIAATPAQRWASAAEVGEVVAFLCSSRAAFINGVALPVDGGLHLGPL